MKSVFTIVSLAAFVALVPPSLAQKAGESVKVQQVTGLAGMKNNTGGKLAVEGGNLQFSHGKTKVDLGLLAAPYGSGRFLSLFRTKLDTLTVKYRDADGALHGAIFTMPAGKAEEFKKELLAQGAHTSVAPEQAANSTPAAKEEKQ
jgi:hypothetical protein